MKILVINPFGGTEIHARDNLARVARADTDFDIVNIGDVYPLHNNQWLYFRHECINGTIERALQAERDGFDAVFLSCQLDVGLYECRQLLQIPVTATLESAALLAYQMGRTFSLLSVDYQNGQIQKMLLDIYGLSGKLASIRSFAIDAEALKLAEMWVDLARAGLPPVSRRGFFERPPAAEYQRLRRFIGKDATPLTDRARDSLGV